MLPGCSKPHPLGFHPAAAPGAPQLWKPPRGDREQEEIHPNLETSAAVPAPRPPARRAGGTPGSSCLGPASNTAWPGTARRFSLEIQALRGQEYLRVSAPLFLGC